MPFAHRDKLWLSFMSALLVLSCAHKVEERAQAESPEHTHSLGGSSHEAVEAKAVQPKPDVPRVAPKGEALSLRATLSHETYSATSPEHILYKIDLFATPEIVQARRPLNLALLIDASGSMKEDEKFGHAMQAAQLVVENLSPRDIVSLIAFNASSIVLSPAGRAVNREFLSHRLTKLSPQGWTNLSAGLLEAFAQIESQDARDELRHVIVLTDGNANRGVTALDELEAMVRSAQQRGIGLSTLGCGTDFDEKALISLARAGGGRYTFMSSAEKIPGALALELGGLLKVIAQNLKIEIQASPDTRITRMYGQLTEGGPSVRSFFLGDLRVGDHSFFLFELAPLRFESGSTAGADVTLTWDNPATGSRERQRLRSRASYSPDRGAVLSGRNMGVESYARVLELLERAEEALVGLDIEQFEFVKESFEPVYQEVHDYAIAARDQQLLNQAYLLKHAMAELSAVAAQGMIHDHEEAKRSIEKEISYRRYLLQHHGTRLPSVHSDPP